METFKARKTWKDVFQILKKHKCQPRLLHSPKLSIKIDGEINFQDKNRLREFMTVNHTGI